LLADGFRGACQRQIDQETIVEAIVRDGFDLVITGTRNYRDAVAKWPAVEKRFLRPVARFYGEADYLKDPAVWDKGGAIKGAQSAADWAAGYEQRKAARA
jgi:hypothetical protein